MKSRIYGHQQKVPTTLRQREGDLEMLKAEH
jgi:hypothetical protein